MGSTVVHSGLFESAVNFVIDVLEGGDRFTNDPNDAGGATRWGISRRANPDLDVRSLTREQAVEIYRERYWAPSKAGLLPPGVDLQHFAAYVNMGRVAATRCLQHAVGGSVFGGNVTVDGVFGPKTLEAVRAFRPQLELRARHTRECLEYYNAVVKKYPYNLRFLHGWIGRVARVADEAGWRGRMP